MLILFIITLYIMIIRISILHNKMISILESTSGTGVF